MSGKKTPAVFGTAAKAMPRKGWSWAKTAVGVGLLACGGNWSSAESTEPPRPTITNPAWLWGMPTGQKAERHPLRIEGRVNYYDPGFKMLWIEHQGVSNYIQLSSRPLSLRTGQQVVIEGSIVPQDGLDGDRVKVTVLEEESPVTPIALSGPINDPDHLASRIVSLEAYVSSQQLIDDEHLRLILLYENRPVICWVRPDDARRLPKLQGNLVRVTGLYSGRFDTTKTRMTIELWVGRQADVRVLGTLDSHAWFKLPITPIDAIYRQQDGAEIRVRGRLEIHRPGESLIIRDVTGQIEARTFQTEHLQPGESVEVVGRVRQGEEWILEHALYRRAPAEPAVAVPPVQRILDRIADIRALSRAEVTGARAVDLTGMVTWSLPESDFLFLQDTTGGIRVRYDRARTGNIPYGKHFNVKGVTRAGPGAPMVELETYVDLGAMSHPRPRRITLETARTGGPDGEWVELRGFLRHTDTAGDWHRIHVITPTGEFTGHLQSPVALAANPGSLIRMRGVCDVSPAANGQPVTVNLRVPFLHDIDIEQDAPANYLDLPRRALEDVEQMSSGGEMQRVRVAGTVVHAVPGRMLYLQEGRVGLPVFSQEKTVVRPGDQIEVVGILGREGVHTVLREAVYHRTGPGEKPVPENLADLATFNPANDYRLVRVSGTLIDQFHDAQRSRFTLQRGPVVFEARLEHEVGAPPPRVELTAELELTGLHKVIVDDTQQARGLELLLRSPADIVVTRPAPLWTVRRALAVAGGLAGCILLGLAWITSLRRRVNLQTEQIRKQLEQQARLEAELQHAARLESLGVLAGGIAHDYNNILTIILGNLSLMKMETRVMEIEGKRMGEIERGVFRARDLTRQLLTFASGGEPHRTAVDFSAVTHLAADTILMDTIVKAEFEAEPGLWSVGADRDQLILAVQNLIRNAAQAMPGGGVVRLVLANETVTSGGLAHGRYVRLSVADTGPGIPADILPRIFDPYFTTKKDTRGLGLATTFSIVKKHGGRIEATTASRKGTVFTLWLPVAVVTEDKTAPAPPAPVAAATPERPRILLMDDEESIRFLAGVVFERMGLDPTLVADGEKALQEFEAARKAGRPFALLILDLTIVGGMGGKQAIRAIRLLDPQVPAIVASGYSSDPVMANYVSYGFQAAVTKPFDVATLAEAVRRFVPQAQPV